MSHTQHNTVCFAGINWQSIYFEPISYFFQFSIHNIYLILNIFMRVKDSGIISK